MGGFAVAQEDCSATMTEPSDDALSISLFYDVTAG